MVDFYNVYLKLCNQKGVTPSRAALDMGISKVAVSNWKSRRNFPTDANLQKIADYFGVTIKYLKGEEQAEKNPLPENEERIKQLYELTEGLTDEDINVLRAFAAGLKANRKND